MGSRQKAPTRFHRRRPQSWVLSCRPMPLYEGLKCSGRQVWLQAWRYQHERETDEEETHNVLFKIALRA